MNRPDDCRRQRKRVVAPNEDLSQLLLSARIVVIMIANQARAIFVRDLRYPAIDGLRFLAALAVFIVHIIGAVVFAAEIPADQMTRDSASIAYRAMFLAADAGNAGVDIFFVISGFLMGRIVLSDRPFSYPGFVRNRFVRIYPAFFVSLVLMTAFLCTQLAGYGWEFRLKDFVGNLLFLNAFYPPTIIKPYNSVTWSIGYEFAFYLVIPFARILKNWAPRLAIGPLMLVIAVATIPSEYGRFAGLFVGTVIAGFSDEQLARIARWLPGGPVALALCAAIFLKSALLIAASTYFVLLYVFSACLVIALSSGQGTFRSLCKSAPLRVLGTVSYSFYLFHLLAMNIVMFGFLRAFGPVPGIGLIGSVSFIIGSFGLAVMVALVSYLCFEAPYFLRAAPTVGGTPSWRTSQ